MSLASVSLFTLTKKLKLLKLFALKKKYYCLWGVTFFTLYFFYFYFDKLNKTLLVNFCNQNLINFFFIKKPLSTYINNSMFNTFNKNSYFVLASNNLEWFVKIILHLCSSYFLLSYFGYFFNMCLAVNHLLFFDQQLVYFQYNVFFMQKYICLLLNLHILWVLKCLLCLVFFCFKRLQMIIKIYGKN